MSYISEKEFRNRVEQVMSHIDTNVYGYVTGPERSGAIASVYVSHISGIQFIPYRQIASGRGLIVDTAMYSGKTLKKAMRVYPESDVIYFWKEPPRVKFWYEEKL